jgi:hypothetical protein
MPCVRNCAKQGRIRTAICNFWFYSLSEKIATEQVIIRTLSLIKEKWSKSCTYLKDALLFLFPSEYYSTHHTFPWYECYFTVWHSQIFNMH